MSEQTIHLDYLLEQLTKTFKQNELNLISDVIKTNRIDNTGNTISWFDLATKHQIRCELNTKKQRRTAANDVWRKFCRIMNKNNSNLEIVKQTFNSQGELLYETKKRTPSELQEDKNGFTIEKITTNPYGGEFVTYKKDRTNLTVEQIENTVNKLFEDFKDLNKNNFEYIVNTNNEPNNKIALVNLFDAHLDKIPIKDTCKEDSSLERNIQVYKNTIQKIKQELLKIENLNYIIYPVGNDLFHTNTFGLPSTKKGTALEYYGSQEEAYYTICNLVTETIIELSKISPVFVVMIKGNHDEDKITTLGFWLKKYFENYAFFKSLSSHLVEVDSTRNQRKYIQFGKNLIGFAHGDKEKSKIDQLPIFMAQEAPKLWGNTIYRKMFLGDLHHGFEYKFLKSKDQPGVEIEFLRSVGTTDTWHEDFGWIGIPKTAYIQIFDSEEGEYNRIKINIK
jgi:hypothetical protein